MSRFAPIILSSIPLALFAQSSIAPVVISQIYGGGGNQGATLTNDYVELLNRTTSPVDVTGWTVQYASASGSNWDRATLTGTIPPGRYYLLQAFRGNGGTVPLPTPDATSGLALSQSAGKVALVRSSTALTGAKPQSADIVDLVGYGTADHAEGKTAPELSNSTAAVRRGGGCTDTNDNSADFQESQPLPRNSASAANLCGISAPVPVISQGGVVNGASYAGGAIAPGQIISIFGTNIGPPQLATLQLNAAGTHVVTSLAGTRVLFDGVAAPIIYCSSNQTSVVVPYSTSGKANTVLEIELDGRKSNQVSLPVAASAPGIFSLDSTGKGQGAILNQTYEVNGPARPARKGEVVIVFATGAGQLSPTVDDGSITAAPLPQLTQSVTARIGGRTAEVLYAGMAPGLISGVLQLNLKVPESLATGGALPLDITVGGRSSQDGITVNVEGPPATPSAPGTGTEIEEKLRILKTEAIPPPLSEIPNDRIGIPQDWLALVSWNIQVGGTSAAVTAERPPLVRSALQSLLGGTYQVLAAQEISNSENAEVLRGFLPGGAVVWKTTFTDTTDSMDNAFWYRVNLNLKDSFTLFIRDPSSGARIEPNTDVAVHPPQVARFEVGDFDFTLISLHLTFEDGNTGESAREFGHILNYLDSYFQHPEHDPDVVICGDFNIPSKLSGQSGSGGITLDQIIERDSRFQTGERRFAVTVHQPTSRSSAANGGVARNNYDHCVLSADTLEEFIQARRVDPAILTDHPEDPEQRLTSDHFPIVAFFKTRGPGIALDAKNQIRTTR